MKKELIAKIAALRMTGKEQDIPEYKAAKCFINRRDREEHPDGVFDKGGRWYPSVSEECGCCDNIRRPSGGYPYSLMTHCRSLGHVCNLFSVNKRDVKQIIKIIDK